MLFRVNYLLLVNRNAPNKLASFKLTGSYILKLCACSQDVRLVAEKESFVQLVTENIKELKLSYVSRVWWK